MKIKPPIGYHLKTIDYVSSSNYQTFPQETTKINWRDKGIKGIKWNFYPEPAHPFIARIPFGRVWGTNGSVITPDNKLLWDVSFEYNRLPPTHSIYEHETLPSITYLPERVAVITFQVSFNYFHWMFDVLPRLELLRQSGFLFDRIVINRGKHYREDYCQFQDESLQLLGISKDQLLEVDAQTHLLAKELIVSSPTSNTAHVSKNVCQFLRREFLEKGSISKGTGYERIFISREDARHRPLLNENEVFNVLEKYGFKKVKLSTLSFIEKIKLFQSAKVIVSPHGAGLTNIVFCTPATKVIELFSPTYLVPCFFVISQHMDLHYYGLVGEAVPIEESRSIHSDPIFINIENLKRKLSVAGL
ncbi:glycosyltransferase family 61 protein [Neobacillus niacini]|uniref:glycosyltransferase family 61 protein n=1 Tax=Neobacillus niacini TaxID=86668 RepID=UPI002FFEBCD3